MPRQSRTRRKRPHTVISMTRLRRNSRRRSSATSQRSSRRNLQSRRNRRLYHHRRLNRRTNSQRNNRHRNRKRHPAPRKRHLRQSTRRPIYPSQHQNRKLLNTHLHLENKKHIIKGRAPATTFTRRAPNIIITTRNTLETLLPRTVNSNSGLIQPLILKIHSKRRHP